MLKLYNYPMHNMGCTEIQSACKNLHDTCNMISSEYDPSMNNNTRIAK